MNRNQFKIPLYFVIALFLVSCGNKKKNENAEDSKLKVLSSFSIITNMVEEIGKDQVEVHNLVPIGTDPHEYDPRPNDVKFATSADLIIYNGLNLEGGDSGWLIKLAHSVKADEDKLIEVAKNITPMYVKDEKGVQEVNPHAFISPKVGMAMAEAIRDALIEADEENKEFYKENAEDYLKRLEAIHQSYHDKIAEIPAERRVFMASELAFQYMTKEYGLKEGYIWAIDTDDIGTPTQIKNAIAFINKNNPPVLFVESNVDRRPMETVSKATGVEIYKDPIFSDELGKPGDEGDSYIKYLEYNLDIIYKGLQE